MLSWTSGDWATSRKAEAVLGKHSGVRNDAVVHKCWREDKLSHLSLSPSGTRPLWWITSMFASNSCDKSLFSVSQVLFSLQKCGLVGHCSHVALAEMSPWMCWSMDVLLCEQGARNLLPSSHTALPAHTALALPWLSLPLSLCLMLAGAGTQICSMQPRALLPLMKWVI